MSRISKPQAANDDRLDGDDTRVRGEGDTPAPRLPHERDESGDAQADGAAVDDPKQRKAHDDIEGGRVDTDKGPVMEQTYERVRGKGQDER